MSTQMASKADIGTQAIRNSSIELLRILAMLMIVTSHCVMFSDVHVLTQPLGINKILVETFLYSGGKIGVVAFFAISAWFLTEKGGIRAGLRRAWLLEQEMLFWSLALFVVTALTNRAQLSLTLIVQSLFPTITALWWYPTAYAVFLLVFPFLMQGMRALDKGAHGALCIVMIVLWTVLDLVMPLSGVGLPGGDVFSFVYIYTLIAYYRWYMQSLSAKQAWGLLIGGYALIAIGAVAGSLVYQITGKVEKLQVYLSSVEFRLPVLMVGFALFVLFAMRSFHSAIINAIAASTFGVYLISEYPVMRQWIWHNPWVDFPAIMHSPFAFIQIIGVACLAFVGCSILDQLRIQLFKVTVNRHRGRWFDALLQFVNTWIVRKES
ncbi:MULTISPECIES: acyltransferase [unclassified Bifidobacterium]|uniref:acyltransferase family protein n=1 Tax=unclassified Bifidobacterium TaxID=2608897 RepID=UPI00112875BE|nr:MULTISPECIES: acyltransferase [unclassified Bifidobacterium]TPF78572.1 hypothetical protein BW09_03625 [Bifidobacterium sp. UTCIF-1]TPF80853.1 hypothetical protein BW08_02590 [Bifidobacterium sp. UTCIF-24]TPF82708.1 hypothetical protein BW12_03040 [Bifidobacterium sp. UTCIF-3]TPF84518.1 hypothetical protein BW07_04515 [Bifidobacterium sp. UTCIF-36]TPF90921.1 hypothetical protein BW10_01515 [Bifidobacterium sp. UTBIF-56]